MLFNRRGPHGSLLAYLLAVVSAVVLLKLAAAVCVHLRTRDGSSAHTPSSTQLAVVRKHASNTADARLGHLTGMSVESAAAATATALPPV